MHLALSSTKQTFHSATAMSACPRKRTFDGAELMSAKGQEGTSNVRRSRLDMAEFKNKRPPQLAASINGQKSKFAITRDP